MVDVNFSPLVKSNDLYEVRLCPLMWLKAHEEFDVERLKEVYNEVISAKGYIYPIIVDSKTGIILDGHHRFEVAKLLNLSSLPCILVNYLENNHIVVKQWVKNDSDNQSSLLTLSDSNKYVSSTQTSHPMHISLAEFLFESNRMDEDKHQDHIKLFLNEKKKPHDQYENIPIEDHYYSHYNLFVMHSNRLNSDQIDAEKGDLEKMTFDKIEPSLNKTISKALVINLGLHGKLLPPKSTKHVLPSEITSLKFFFSLNTLL